MKEGRHQVIFLFSISSSPGEDVPSAMKSGVVAGRAALALCGPGHTERTGSGERPASSALQSSPLHKAAFLLGFLGNLR